MAEPEKDQIGDGQDNFGQAAGKAIQAAKQISHDAAAEAAVKGAEATANAAAAVVQASTESGKAVAEIAAGTAAGGPWGAILSAAWAMRHSLFKVLVCILRLNPSFTICSIPGSFCLCGRKRCICLMQPITSAGRQGSTAEEAAIWSSTKGI